MIEISKLTESDVGRNVTYHREVCNVEHGKLSSWNYRFVFVRFKGPTGEACEPADVSFDHIVAEVLPCAVCGKVQHVDQMLTPCGPASDPCCSDACCQDWNDRKSEEMFG